MDDIPTQPSPATPTLPDLAEKIREIVRKKGPISFPEYMQHALYDPLLGYYSKGQAKIGRSGDFFTSVSVGPLFGELLSERFLTHWSEIGKPSEWRIVEFGANDGKLALDILNHIKNSAPDAYGGLEYAIAEPLEIMRKAQADYLSAHKTKLKIVEKPASLGVPHLPGVVFANELLDALPFHTVEFDGTNWKERKVQINQAGNFEFISEEISGSTDLGLCTHKLGNEFPKGYQTEVRTNFASILAEIDAGMADSLLLFIDYGFAHPEYYNPGRVKGTLRTFTKHQAGEDPFMPPGEVDITAHVDFTDLAHAARKLGYAPVAFSSQGSYLTNLARARIHSGELSSPRLIRQFQTLTHPAQLGSTFHAVEFLKNVKVDSTAAHRLALEP